MEKVVVKRERDLKIIRRDFFLGIVLFIVVSLYSGSDLLIVSNVLGLFVSYAAYMFIY